MWQAPKTKTGCVRISAMVYEGPNSWFADDGELTKVICDEKLNPKRKLKEDECCACDEAKYNVRVREIIRTKGRIEKKIKFFSCNSSLCLKAFGQTRLIPKIIHLPFG